MVTLVDHLSGITRGCLGRCALRWTYVADRWNRAYPCRYLGVSAGAGSPDPLLTALLGGVVGAALTQVFQFVHNHQAHQRQLERDRKNDERALRDSTRDRLHITYAEVYKTAALTELVSHSYATSSEPQKERDARQASGFEARAGELNTAIAPLRLEPLAAQIVSAADELASALGSLGTTVRRNATAQDPTLDAQIITQAQSIVKLSRGLQTRMRDHLSTLSTAI